MRPPDPALLQAFDLLDAGRHRDAIAMFHRLAGEEEPGALATLAQLTWTGDLVAQDFEQAR